MAYWCAAHLQPNREALALHCLGLAGYETYFPRLRDRRIRHGRKIELRPALFPGYCFVLIQLQWHTARWAPGTLGLIMDGIGPAKVPDAVIAEIRRREVDGLIELAPPSPLRRGARVRILRGPFTGHLAIFADMRPRQRVEILLQLLGGEQRVTLAKKDIEGYADALSSLSQFQHLQADAILLQSDAGARHRNGGGSSQAAIHPHMLRHACGYALANAGHDTRALQAWLGHRNIQHTVRYTELAPDRFKDFWR